MTELSTSQPSSESLQDSDDPITPAKKEMKMMLPQTQSVLLLPWINENVLTQLTRQLEFYFSQQNLVKDIYLQTLRNLNDGYVPVKILMNFTQVRILLPSSSSCVDHVRIEALLCAAREYSNQLQVVQVDTKTGKVVEQQEVSSNSITTLAAIGPIETLGVKHEVDDLATLVVPTICRTIILREVASEVTYSHILEAFDFDDCPPIKSIHLDVGNIWFVTLDTKSRDDMVYVMMQLQQKTLADSPIHARLKSAAHLVETSPVVWYPPFKKKKKKKRGKKNKKSIKSSPSPSSSSIHSGKGNGRVYSSPPSLGEEDFPILHEKKVEWDTIPEDVKLYNDDGDDEEDNDDDVDEEPKSLRSDAASTATTASSSTESVPKKLAGYAAALKGVPMSVTEISNKEQHTAVAGIIAPGGNGRQSNSPLASKMDGDRWSVTSGSDELSDSVHIQPSLVWGNCDGRRSFADVAKVL